MRRAFVLQSLQTESMDGADIHFGHAVHLFTFLAAAHNDVLLERSSGLQEMWVPGYDEERGRS